MGQTSQIDEACVHDRGSQVRALREGRRAWNGGEAVQGRIGWSPEGLFRVEV